MTAKTTEPRKTYSITIGSACDAPDYVSDDSDYYSYLQTKLLFSGTYTEAEEKAKEMLQNERMKMSNVSFTANFVSFLPLKLSIRSTSSENRSNGKAGLWTLLATAIAPAISWAGL